MKNGTIKVYIQNGLGIPLASGIIGEMHSKFTSHTSKKLVLHEVTVPKI